MTEGDSPIHCSCVRYKSPVMRFGFGFGWLFVFFFDNSEGLSRVFIAVFRYSVLPGAILAVTCGEMCFYSLWWRIRVGVSSIVLLRSAQSRVATAVIGTALDFY